MSGAYYNEWERYPAQWIRNLAAAGHVAEWIACTDGKSRPAQPGVHPLVAGTANRVGRLRAYGNAIVAPLAAEFIGAVMDVLDARSAA